MTAGKVSELELVRSGPSEGSIEMMRLRRELDETRRRLEEEVAYYRAELESTRQRVEKQGLRLHAEEVAKRRRAEEQVLGLRADLREAQMEAERARQRYEELNQRLLQLDEDSKRHTQEEVDKVRMAARLAWQNAEDELSRTEQELSGVKRLLQQERERCKQLEETISRMRGERGASNRPDPESLRLIASLKQALWTTAQARRRAESELAALRAGAAPIAPQPEQQVKAVYRAFQSTPAAEPRQSPSFAGDGVYRELDTNELKSLVIGDGDHEFSEEFLLMPSDASLDRDTFERLQSLPEPEPGRKPVPAVAPVEPARPQAKAAPAPRPQVQPPAYAQETMFVDQKRNGVGRTAMLLGIGAAASLGIYWLFGSGALADGLAALAEWLR